MRRVLSVLVALALPAAGCSSSGLGGGTAARLLDGDDVLVARDGGWRTLEEGATVPDGARVRTGLDTATFELDRGELWLGASATVTLDGDIVELDRGEVVLRSRGATARWDAVEVTGQAVYRLSPGASPRVGVYEGEATVSRPGERRRVPALRQMGLAARRLAAEPEPLYYTTDDPWDRLLLPKAIAFDEEVSRLARGIDREYGTEPQPAEFYASFAAVEPSTVPPLAATARRTTPDGAFGPPSDALVTLFVASAVAGAGGQSLEEAVRAVGERRAAGARWGLLALELGVDTQELSAAVDLGRERRETVAPSAGRPSGPRPRPPGGGGNGGTPRPRPRPTDPTPGPGEPTESPPPDDDPRETIQDTIENIIGGPPGAASVRGGARGGGQPPGDGRRAGGPGGLGLPRLLR